MDNAQVAIAYQDADEFAVWWERDARVIAAAVAAIGRIEEK